MLFRTEKRTVEYEQRLGVAEMPFCKTAALFYINGSGALSTSIQTLPDSCENEKYLKQITLNGVPLIHINTPECPTCESLLATGKGIENAECGELRNISEKLNGDFADFDTAVQNLEPLLSLLESGLYVVADTLCYPVDGNGNFFWNVPDTFTSNPATAGAWLHDEDFDHEWIMGHPLYLYPTQSAACYDEQRVQHYMDRLSASEDPPRAVAYHCGEFLSFLLDGHHKAAAAALLGQPVHCLVIIPLSCCCYKTEGKRMVPSKLIFGSIELEPGEVPEKYVPRHEKHALPEERDSLPETAHTEAIRRRSWEEKYLKAAEKYPTVKEYAVMTASGVHDLSDATVEACLASFNAENRKKLRSILLLMQVQKDVRLRKVALACARKLEYCKLKVQAFRILCGIKADEEIEQFFIDWIIEDDDPHSLLGRIANSYWDSGSE